MNRVYVWLAVALLCYLGIGWSCYLLGKMHADRWWHENPMQSKCVQINQPPGNGYSVIWGDCKIDCLKRVFTKRDDGKITAQCFCEAK